MKFFEKTILITGGSSGIGKDFALKAAKDKCNIILVARDLNKLNEVKKSIEELGSSATIIKSDLSNLDQIQELFKKVNSDFEKIDLVFNNAGLNFIKRFEDSSIEEIVQIIDVNFKAAILVSKYSLEIFNKQGFGHLITTSSVASEVKLPEWAVYCATKAGIKRFIDTLRLEIKNKEIKLTTLHPGPIKTDFFTRQNKDNYQFATSSKSVAELIYKISFSNKKRVFIPKIFGLFSFFSRFFG